MQDSPNNTPEQTREERPYPPQASRPCKSEIRRRTKMIAKALLAHRFFPIVFALALELLTSYGLALVFSALAERLFPGATFEIPIMGAFNYAGAILGLVANLLALPLILGVAEYLLAKVRNVNMKFADIFLWFSDGEKLKRLGKYALYLTVYYLGQVVLFTVPSGFLLDTMDAISQNLNQQILEGAQQLTVPAELIPSGAVVAISILAILLFEFLSIRLLLTLYLFVDSPAGSPFAAAAASWRIMRGHTWEYFVVQLSFIGWYFACAFTVFVAAVYFLPYQRMVNVVFTEYVRSDYYFRHVKPKLDQQEQEQGQAEPTEDNTASETEQL